jgi:hypothetical protein
MALDKSEGAVKGTLLGSERAELAHDLELESRAVVPPTEVTDRILRSGFSPNKLPA